MFQVSWNPFNFFGQTSPKEYSSLREIALTYGCDLKVEIEQYLKKGASIEEADEFGQTALHHAAGIHRVEAINALLDQGANINAIDNGGRTPLHAAVADVRGIDALKALIDRGANVNHKDHHGNTPLDKAYLPNWVNGIILLKEHGAHFGTLTLINAAKNSDLPFIRTLVAKGLSVNSQDGEGQTALHFAAEKGNVEAITLLIELKADRNIEDKKGRKPIHFAKDGETIKALLGINAL